LSGIAARERDDSCRPGHPCPRAGGLAARDRLVELIGRKTGVAPSGHVLVQGEPLRCRSEGSGKGTRTAAWCSNRQAGDLSRAMVASGHALKWDQYWPGGAGASSR
jgi:endonuclease YncB( thermonuclease family)